MGLAPIVHTRRYTLSVYAVAFPALVVTAIAMGAAVTGSMRPKTLAEILVLPAVVFVFIRLSRATQTVVGLALACLYGVLILVPVDYLPLSKQIVGLRIDPLLLCALLGLLGPRASEARARAWPSVMAVAVVLLGAITYLTVPGRNPRYYLLSYLLVGGLVLVLAWRGSRTRADLRTVSRVIMWSGGAAAALGVVEYVLKRNPIFGSYYPTASPMSGGAVYFPGTYGYRITTTIGHPLDVGMVLTVVLIVTAGIALSTSNVRERRASVGIALVTLLAIAMTKSRTDLILAPSAVVLLVFLLQRRVTARDYMRHLRARPLMMMVVIGLAIAVWATRGVWEQHFNGNTATTSTQARVIGLHYVEKVLPSSLPLGLGFGASQAKLGATGQYSVSGVSAEDGWLELLIDAGPLFAVTLLAIPLIAGVSAIRNASRDDPLRLCHGVAAFAVIVNAASFNGLVTARTMIFLLLVESGIAASAVRRVAAPPATVEQAQP
jgi:hypothetical protein